ncbi:MAG: exodeoxyribonuclease VII large subunit [Clostridia bacterium]|nr:exodeoxyribonuclease VII large subunit [Clostridia bacterium]
MNSKVPVVITVSQLNMYVKSILESDDNLRMVYVCGEISNFTHHYRTGHWYMSLKDEQSQVKAVMFKTSCSRVRFMPENGMKVLVRARASVYERDGQFQLYIEDMQPDGLGALHLAYEQLKAKLEKKGYFDVSHKKELPAYSDRIAVITSETGAAVHDILSVLSRRCPTSTIVLCPVQVQGDSAPGLIAEAIEKVNKLSAADVIILGRGGGSIEDLWAFNDERVANAIYDSKIPVVSAVGHETDFTICDFVADVRAATPSVAAEICSPDCFELCAYYRMYFASQRENLLSMIEAQRAKVKLYSMSNVLKVANERINSKRMKVAEFSKHIISSINVKVENERFKLASLSSTLHALSPLKTLAKGYALVSSNGRIINSVDVLTVGDEIELKLNDGDLKCDVAQIIKRTHTEGDSV